MDLHLKAHTNRTTIMIINIIEPTIMNNVNAKDKPVLFGSFAENVGM